MKAEDKAKQIVGRELFEQLQGAGVKILWESEFSFLNWAANTREQLDVTYKYLDKLQRQGLEEGQAMKQVQIRSVNEQEARKKYHCQCGQETCQETILPKQRYIRVKLVEKTLGELKNREKTISLNCTWWEKWREFLG